LYGDQGTIVLEEGRIVTWQLSDADAEEETAMLSLEAGAGSGSQDPMGISSENHRLQIQDLIEAIHGDRAPAVAGDEGRKAVEIVRAIYRSATTGMPVQLPLADDG
jgi:predicted dehydrogenase